MMLFPEVLSCDEKRRTVNRIVVDNCFVVSKTQPKCINALITGDTVDMRYTHMNKLLTWNLLMNSYLSIIVM